MCVSMKRMTICVIQLGTLEPTLSVKKASAIFCESLVILQPGLMWYTTYLLLLNFEYANYLKVSINFDVLMLKCQEEYEFYRPFFKKKWPYSLYQDASQKVNLWTLLLMPLRIMCLLQQLTVLLWWFAFMFSVYWISIIEAVTALRLY